MHLAQIQIPILGQCAAGSPLEWLPIEKWRWIRPLVDCQPHEEVYGMEVVGSSLVGAKIYSGDILIYVKGRKCKPGDLCVLQTPHGITAKFVFPRADDEEILLRAANKRVKDQIWPCKDVNVLGIVKRVERDL